MVIIYHNADHDGQLSAALLAASAKDESVKYAGVNFGDDFKETIMQAGGILKGETVYIADFSLPFALMDWIYEQTSNVVWLDHHKTAIEAFESYGRTIRGLRCNGIAASMLCWLYINDLPAEKENTKKAPLYVQMVAGQDVWDFSVPKTDAFHYGLELEKCNPVEEENIWKMLAENPEEHTERMIAQGEIVMNYRKKLAERNCKRYGFSAILDGKRVFALNMGHVSTADFQSVEAGLYEMFVGFAYDGDKWTYSLRAANADVDCAEVAQKYGGGGHKGAAGFSTKELVLQKAFE